MHDWGDRQGGQERLIRRAHVRAEREEEGGKEGWEGGGPVGEASAGGVVSRRCPSLSLPIPSVTCPIAFLLPGTAASIEATSSTCVRVVSWMPGVGMGTGLQRGWKVWTSQVLNKVTPLPSSPGPHLHTCL